MGWQSYYYIYDTEDQRDQILDMIRSHNNEKNWEIVGEELEMVCIASLRRRTKKGKKIIMFGNGGGRCLTFQYFSEGGIELEPYCNELDKRINRDKVTDIKL